MDLHPLHQHNLNQMAVKSRNQLGMILNKKLLFQKALMVLYAIVLTINTGCSNSDGYKESPIDLKNNLAEMKNQLNAINQKLNNIPIEKMTVYPKSGAAYASFVYKVENKEQFKKTLFNAAQADGFFIPNIDVSKQNYKILIYLCNSRLKNTYLSAEEIRQGTVVVGIYENYINLYSNTCP